MASERRKFFVDTRQFAIALRDGKLKPIDLDSGIYYLECTAAELRDLDGKLYTDYCALFCNICFGDAQLAKRWQHIVYRNVVAAIATGRGAFRERKDIRRLSTLNKLILPFLKNLLGDDATGIEARDFYDALRILPYYFDVI